MQQAATATTAMSRTASVGAAEASTWSSAKRAASIDVVFGHTTCHVTPRRGGRRACAGRQAAVTVSALHGDAAHGPSRICLLDPMWRPPVHQWPPPAHLPSSLSSLGNKRPGLSGRQPPSSLRNKGPGPSGRPPFKALVRELIALLPSSKSSQLDLARELEARGRCDRAPHRTGRTTELLESSCVVPVVVVVAERRAARSR